MTNLPSISVLSFSFCAFLAGCEEQSDAPSKTGKARSEAVVTADAAASPASTTQEAPSGTASAKKPAAGSPEPSEAPSAEPRQLCAGQWEKAGKPFDPPESSRASSPGFDPPAEDIPTGGGALTWINFWAAWCKPCKEEIPRLRSWEEKLNASGNERLRLVFVSLDDDERQLEAFMEEQPASGLKQTYWLTDGKQRSDWLESVGMEDDPELPTHLLVDAKGKIRCILQGAVEDSDWEQVQKLAETAK